MEAGALKAVIFDLDQTLLDREKSLVSFVRWQTNMLRDSFIDPDRFLERFVELDANGTVWKDIVYEKLISEFGIRDWSAAELLTVYELCFCAFCVPRVGVVEAVTNIAGNYRLGLISNGMSPFQERNFRALGLSSHFESVIVSQAVGLRKPDRAIFELACTELRVRPTEAAYVGDNPTADIEGAKVAGLGTIFVPTRLTPDCPGADATCSEMSCLPEILEGLNGELP